MRHYSKPSIFLRSLLLVSTIWIPAGTNHLTAQKTQHADVTEVVVIEVPVQVTKDGKPVRGLTPDQFEVLDGRKRRDLVGFDTYDLSGSKIEPNLAGLRIPAAAQRRFLLFFDLAFSDPDSIVQAQKAAKEFVSTGLGPADLVGVATHQTSGALNLILGFTSDRRQAELAIETFGLPELVVSRRDPLGISLVPLHWGSKANEWEGGVEVALDNQGGKNRAMLRSLVTQMQNASRQASEMRAILALNQSLTEVAELLRNVEGRKYLVYLSEGFDSSVILGQGAGSTREEQEAIRQQNAAVMRGEYQDVDSNLRFGDTSSQNEFARVVQELLRADCVIQAVDIGGLRAGTDSGVRQESKQGLFMLANGTGGELFENFNNLTEAMSKMLERTSVTYVLAFQAEDLKLDGEFHKLKVKLEGGPKGARLVYRPGYFAPRPYSELSPRERSLSAASRLYGEAGGELKVATLAAPFEIDSQTAHVPSLIEIDGADLLKGNQGGQVTAEIFAYAVAEDGEVRDFYNQILGIDIEKAGPTLQQTGLKFWSQFELPPGSYVVRVLVRNADTGASGVSVFPFRVPDASQQEPVLLVPMFPEPTGRWVSVRGQRAEEAEHDYPFTVQGKPFVPAAKPVLVPGQSTPVLLAGYGFEESVRIRGQLLTLDGKPSGRVSLNVGERRLAEQPGLAQWAATLSLGDLEPGDYVLKVTATEPASGEAHSSSITVSVSG